jgi:transcriptional regulator with XRE-family HTH domain
MSSETQFGTFFRAMRKALGLNLREFCRRNGFDPGNISRLERGLAPPPQAQEILEAFARALKFKPGTDRWERFFELAAAATGRIPPDLLQGRTTAAQLPRLFRQLRGGQGHKNWVTARHLAEWADTLPARSMLPQLVRRLIHATGRGVTYRGFPAGEQVQRPDWDGVAEATGTDEFVPEGVSGWEMGVDKDPAAKFEDDFAKRTKNARGLTKRETTFVFVTPRKWEKKGDRVEAKTKLGIWKEVRVYDSASLEEWLECAPAVDFWLARQLGLCPDGVIDVDEHWKNLQALTDPSLGPEVYLASRGEQLGELKDWLAGPPDTLLIDSRSPAEALDFVVAASRRPDFGEIFEVLPARALIVETRDAWRSLAVGDARLVLVVHPALAIEAELVVEAVRNGHHVIVCASGPSGSQSRRIELPRVSGLDLQKALEAQGVERPRAEDLATSSGGSIAVLKRRTARHPGTVHPEWSRSPCAREVVPFLLAGRWENDSEGDRLALEKLAGAPYRDVVALAERWSGPPEPMLTCSLSRRELVSRDDSWALVSQALNDDDLRRFKQVSLEVLGEPDPACDLPSDERWQAKVLGKVRTHSATLRSGLAESLALLGARPPEHKGLSLDPRGLANYVVRSLLDGKGWKAWASLSSELPLLAEAAPDAFLSALENDLDARSKRSPAVLKLFESDASPFFGPNQHTGLLFALEGLAWDSEWLPRASRLLARLYEDAPGTKLGSPMRTLEQVFMPWYPQTTAPVEERVRILESVSKKHPKAGWRLLLGLLPTRPSMVSTNRRPAFRNWALQWSEGGTRADRALQVEACSHLVVELAGNDAGRLKDAIEVFENLPPSAQTKLLGRIAGIDVSVLKVDDRRVLAEAIRKKVNRHRQFARTPWALKEPALEELDRVRTRLEPDDAVARNAWLFGDYWKLLREVERRGRGEEEAGKAVEQLRTAALAEVRLEKGWDGVLSLAEGAACPDQVGWAAGVSATAEDDARVLPALLADARRGLAEFAKGYVQARLSRQGWSWVKKLALDRWPGDQLVEFALAPQRSEPEAWDIVAKRGEEAEGQYWKEVQTFCYSKTPADVVRACTMLANAGRPFAAARQLAIARHRDVSIDPVTIVGILERGRGALADPEQQAALECVDYDVKVLIQELQNLAQAGDARVDVDRVAALEWTYLALLDGHPTGPTTLHTLLEQRPEFFVEILKIIFPRSDEPEAERPELSEGERSRALQGYRLLNSWQRVPGSGPDGSVDGDALRRWVSSVQTLAGNEARREVADHRVGNVFAYAPREADGTWPCIPVRDAIEEFGSEALADGFEVGIMNNRGAYWKAPDEGGSQERARARQYFEWTEASKIEWPKTAASLRRVGEHYEAAARREDAEAESR